MTLFRFKPTSPGLRGKVKILNKFYKKKIFRKYSKNIIFKSGRNNRGRITIRHKGGKLKKYYRFIDFFRNKDFILGKIERIEYDPMRSAGIALVLYEDGERRYIISPKNLFIGNNVISSPECSINIGNCLFLKNIPFGTKIHCIEKNPSQGAKISRSAGCYCTVVSRSRSFTKILTKSFKTIILDNNCKATIGEVGNFEHSLKKYGKAGSKRLKGIRPTVRGVAMNPIDHPHGGGEGKTSGGRDPVSPWGKLSKILKKN